MQTSCDAQVVGDGSGDGAEFTERSLAERALGIEENTTAGTEKDALSEEKMQRSVHEKTWRWINFPANNITWIKDFIITNVRSSTGDEVDGQTWHFFKSNIRLHETNDLGSCIRIPHARAMDRPRSVESLEPSHLSEIKSGNMISLVIPFLDFEAEGHSRVKTGWEKLQQLLEEAYFPFTGMEGVQVSQTLDQTANSNELSSTLRTKENQVIYRWSEKQAEARKKRLPQAEKLSQDGLTKTIWETFDAASTTPLGEDTRRNMTTNAARTQSIRQDLNFKWLMILLLRRYLLEKNASKADELPETMRQGDLHTVSNADEFMKRVVLETVTFLDEFKWAGLGEHILDIFGTEIAIEADKEAEFFNNFTNEDWRAEYVNNAIREAAKCTWRVKDIRDELRLIRQVFEKQIEVVEEFTKILWPPKYPENGSSHDENESFRENFIRDTGLDALQKRLSRMDEDASTTLEGLSNIIQAMQAQASLKEAESARLMNFILLPFTVVTVVFTPLSFMTGLFAVNSEGFPHSDDGDLIFSSSWLWWRMVVGEFGTLVPLFVLVVSIYYLRAGRTEPKKEDKSNEHL